MPKGSTNLTTKAERQELKSLVKNSTKLLQEQLGHRKIEVQNAIEEEILARFESTIKQANEEAKEYRQEQIKLEKEQEKLEDKHEKERNAMSEKQDTAQQRYNEFLNEKEEKDKVVPNSNSRYDGTENDEKYRFGPKDLRGLVSKEFNKISEEHGLAALNIQELELELLKELAVDSLETEDAREFVKKLPTIDKYIPLEAAKEFTELTA